MICKSACLHHFWRDFDDDVSIADCLLVYLRSIERISKCKSNDFPPEKRSNNHLLLQLWNRYLAYCVHLVVLAAGRLRRYLSRWSFFQGPSHPIGLPRDSCSQLPLVSTARVFRFNCSSLLNRTWPVSSRVPIFRVRRTTQKSWGRVRSGWWRVTGKFHHWQRMSVNDNDIKLKGACIVNIFRPLILWKPVLYQ